MFLAENGPILTIIGRDGLAGNNVVIKNEFGSDQRITFTANEALSECSMAEIATNGKCAGRAGSTNRDCNQISGNVLDKKKCEINFSTTLFEGNVCNSKTYKFLNLE